jgi:murein DD-endopeptidase MepM/ murein hydrolase activator NlpD
MEYGSRRYMRVGVAVLAVSPAAFWGLRSSFQAPPPAASVAWAPAHPTQGSAVVIIVRPSADSGSDAVIAVRGTLAGQPLSFERDPDGRFRALGALPANASAHTLLPLALVQTSGDTVHQVAHVAVAAGRFATERLRLPPRFVTPPDTLVPQLREERRIIREALAQTSRTARIWDTTFVRPVAGRVTDRFGTARVLNGETRSRHLGVDLSGGRGTPIHATNRGVVVAAGRFYYQGNAVYVDHGGGLVTVYMHMSRRLVAVGDTVRAGQVIGFVGATGRVTGPHLHWTAYFNRVVFNPLSLLHLPAEEVAAFTS